MVTKTSPTCIGKQIGAISSASQIDFFKMLDDKIAQLHHQVELGRLCEELDADLQKGHTTLKAENLLAKNGPNSLTPPPRESAVLTLIRCLFGGFNWLLWIGSAASIASYTMESLTDPEAKSDNLYLGIVLLLVVNITGLFAFYQERKSSAIMESFSSLAPPHAKVLRDGALIEIEAKNLVAGDVVVIKAGDRIPADVRITEATTFKVDCSSLTGENEPQFRGPACTSDNPLETKNLALFGTNAVEGHCKGIVILTGDKTIMGRIASLTARVQVGKTPIAKEIDHFINIIGSVAVTIGIVFFTISLIYGYSFLEALVFLIGIIVANVPEGIVATMTVCLTLTAIKMRKKNCLVKKLEGVETLGSTSTICSDKTGTLTQNRMTVTHLWVNNDMVKAELDKHEKRSENDITLNMEKYGGSHGALLRCASLCSNAVFKTDDRTQNISKQEATGDASEVAILRYCELVSGDVIKFRSMYPKVAEIPFNSTNKYQLSIHKDDASGRFYIAMKGAPEKIVERCKSVALDDLDEEIDRFAKRSFMKAYEYLGGLGKRVLGFCDMYLDREEFPKGYKFNVEKPNFPTNGFRFLGLIAMIDPPRPSVPQAVSLCQSAGIKVIMVTGDHPSTAEAIARQVHIIQSDCKIMRVIEFNDVVPNFPKETEEEKQINMKQRTIIIHGDNLRLIKAEDLDQLIQNFDKIIFARTSPTQKLQIVEGFQRAGNVVAVTGDGVNDAPALRKADIGIAMGIAGTDVSKEAADMILLDDNFSSIVTGVEEGRIIFDNLKKSIAYTLTSNIPEIMPFLVFVLFGIPLPMSVVAILCIDLGTDLWPAISIAYEEAESDIMKRPPRNPLKDNLVNARLMNFSYLNIGVMQAAAGFMTYFCIMAHNGFHLSTLLWIRDEWDNKQVNDLEDSYGQQWTYTARKHLEHCCHGAFFQAIVVVQWADLLISKTRSNSIVSQGMRNKILNGGLLFTAALATFLLYTPFINRIFSLTPMRLEWTMVSIPFALMIFVYDEIRKFVCRRYPGQWMYRETYY